MALMYPMNEISAVHISSNPFPVTKTFFGQTFAILSLLHLSEENGIGRKSVWCTHHPVREPRFLEYADTVSMEIVQRQLRTTLEYDADVKGGFPSKKFFDFMQGEIDSGYMPVVYHHYPLDTGAHFIGALHQWGVDLGIRNKFMIVPYFHTLLNYHSNSTLTDLVDNVAGNYDFAIMVSEAAKREFGSVLRNDLNSYAVLNGINMQLYTPTGLLKRALRKEVGLRDDLKKVVCFAGRLSPDKGAATLLDLVSKFNKNSRKYNDVGFVIASSFVLEPSCAPSIFKGFLQMERLIKEDRLKFVIDISKYTFADESVRRDYELLLEMISGYSPENLKLVYDMKFNMNGSSRAFGDKLFLNWPVQILSDISVQPSKTEAFGLAVVEAIASGTYLLTNAVGGIPEIFSSKVLGTQFIPSPGVAQEYMDAINSVQDVRSGVPDEYFEIRKKFSEKQMVANVCRITRRRIRRKLSLGRSETSHGATEKCLLNKT